MNKTSPDPADASPVFLTVVECATLLKCHQRTITRLIEVGMLPAKNIGVGKHREYRILQDSLKNLDVPPPAPRPRQPTERRRRGAFKNLLRIGQ